MKQRVLADWNIPPTDPRLGKMNTARWILAHQMQIDRERRDMRRWARFVGTDLSAFSESKINDEEPVRAIPLSAVLNPEAYSKLANTYSSGEESGIEDSEYERQVVELEKSGLLTEIDSIVSSAEEKAKSKKVKIEKEKTNKALDPEPNFFKKIDELTEKAEKLAQKKRRPRIVR